MHTSNTKILVKIKSNQSTTKESLIEILRSFDIDYDYLYQKPSEFTFNALFNTQESAAKICTAKCIQEFSKINCQVIIPPQVRAQRRCQIKKVPILLMKLDNDTLIEEINKINGVQVTDLTSTTNRTGIQLTFTSEQMAKKCCENGVKIENWSIPSDNVTQETYTEIRYCFKCYAIESHTASNCPKDQHYKICSTCSKTDHTYQNCVSNQPKCINCNQNHKTMSFSCPMRRELVKQKLSQGNPKTYASVSQDNRT